MGRSGGQEGRGWCRGKKAQSAAEKEGGTEARHRKPTVTELADIYGRDIKSSKEVLEETVHWLNAD